MIFIRCIRFGFKNVKMSMKTNLAVCNVKFNLGFVFITHIAVIGYGSQGRAQSRNMADSGANVIVGVRENGSSWNLAKEDGMTVKTIEDALVSILQKEKERNKRIVDIING